MSHASTPLPLALTQGDPAGIGPDLTLIAYLKRKENGISPFLFLGDPQVLEARAKLLGLSVPIKIATPESAIADFADALPVLPIAAGMDVVAGQAHMATAKGTISAIEQAVELCFAGRASAVVTNPIAKAVLYQAGFGFPGHTEFLADLASRKTGVPTRPVMLLAGKALSTVPVTIHEPLKAVPDLLTEELIVETCEIIARDMAQWFGLEKPRLAVAGLNPHAGEGGALGAEDEAVIAPAISTLRARGINAFGPLPADTMFHEEARSRYDVAVCMYHDQALIPVKALDFHGSVNVTLGLPFLRTSPDHGTAFGIAGQGIALEHSLVAALKLAAAEAEAKKENT